MKNPPIALRYVACRLVCTIAGLAALGDFAESNGVLGSFVLGHMPLPVVGAAIGLFQLPPIAIEAWVARRRARGLFLVAMSPVMACVYLVSAHCALVQCIVLRSFLEGNGAADVLRGMHEFAVIDLRGSPALLSLCFASGLLSSWHSRSVSSFVVGLVAAGLVLSALFLMADAIVRLASALGFVLALHYMSEVIAGGPVSAAKTSGVMA